jgi:hypothetical protein
MISAVDMQPHEQQDIDAGGVKWIPQKNIFRKFLDDQYEKYLSYA